MIKLDENYHYYETRLQQCNASGRKIEYGHRQRKQRDDYTGESEPSPWRENAVRHLEDGK